jgi:hypothetical protein
MFFQKCQEPITGDAAARYGIRNKLAKYVQQGGLPASGLLRPNQKTRRMVEDPIANDMQMQNPERKDLRHLHTDDKEF